MTTPLTPAQRDTLQAKLLALRSALQTQMQQNHENLAPPSHDEGAVLQRNVAREVDQVLSNLDAADQVRIDRALEALEDGSYGFCGECGCAIPYERLVIEPQTQHCVACKSRWEKEHAPR